MKTKNVTYVGDIIRQEASMKMEMIVSLSHKITKPTEKFKSYYWF